jgi:hypothetical protein
LFILENGRIEACTNCPFLRAFTVLAAVFSIPGYTKSISWVRHTANFLLSGYSGFRPSLIRKFETSGSKIFL